MGQDIMLVASMKDQQTGIYLFESIANLEDYRVLPFEVTDHLKVGQRYFNKKLIDTAKEFSPKNILILKGLGVTKETISELKKLGSKVIIWIFDVTLGGTLIKDCKPYVEVIKEADYFFTISKGSIKELKNLGVNAYWLKEGCMPMLHKEVPINYYEKEKYGADASFIGTIGTKNFHEGRIEFLQSIIDSGINLKIYGGVEHKELLTDEIKKHHMGTGVINQQHSIVCQASKINLGYDGWTDIEESYSARIYRILACGGFLLTNYVKGMENTFKIVKPDEEAKGDEDFATFSNNLDCIRKIRKYLKDDELRKKIGNNGKNTVLNNHTFSQRIEEMMQIIYGK